MDQKINSIEVVYQPKEEQNHEDKIVSKSAFTSQGNYDRDTLINYAARQANMVGYLDQIHGTASPYLDILDEIGDFYQLELTHKDDYLMRLHYGMGRNAAKENIDAHTVDYDYEQLLIPLKEQQIPYQTLYKILQSYPDFQEKKSR